MYKKFKFVIVAVGLLLLLTGCSKQGLLGKWKSSDGKIVLVFNTNNKYKVYQSIPNKPIKLIETGKFELKENVLSIRISIFGGQEKIKMKVQIQKDILILKSGRFSSGFRSFYRLND